MCVSQMAINIWTELHIQLTWKLFESQSINLIIGAGIAVHSSFSLQGGTKASPSRMEIEWIIQLSILWTEIPSNARKLSPHSNRYQQWSTIQKKNFKGRNFFRHPRLTCDDHSALAIHFHFTHWNYAQPSWARKQQTAHVAETESRTKTHSKTLYIILTFRRVIRCYRRACRSCLHSTLLNMLSSMKEFVIE